MTVEIRQGDARDVLAMMPAQSVHACICSPPYYGLRSYGGGEQEIGAERTPSEYVAHLVEVFRGVHRVLRDDGTCWIVIGDSYAAGGGAGTVSGRSTLDHGHGVHRCPKLDGYALGRAPTPAGVPAKNLLMIPHRVALALQDDGWYVRSAITWCKTAPMPESVQDRPTSATEMVFLLSKNSRYFYDATAISEATSCTDYIHAVGKGQGIKGAAAAHRFAAQRSHVPGDGEVAPYLVLASLLGLEGIFGKEWRLCRPRAAHAHGVAALLRWPYVTGGIAGGACMGCAACAGRSVTEGGRVVTAWCTSKSQSDMLETSVPERAMSVTTALHVRQAAPWTAVWQEQQGRPQSKSSSLVWTHFWWGRVTLGGLEEAHEAVVQQVRAGTLPQEDER